MLYCIYIHCLLISVDYKYSLSWNTVTGISEIWFKVFEFADTDPAVIYRFWLDHARVCRRSPRCVRRCKGQLIAFSFSDCFKLPGLQAEKVVLIIWNLYISCIFYCTVSWRKAVQYSTFIEVYLFIKQIGKGSSTRFHTRKNK